MLGKLIKHDVRSISRVFVPMWILAPVMGLLFSLTLRGMWSASARYGAEGGFVVARNGIMSMVIFLLFFGVMVGLTVMTVSFVIQRFWNGLLKEEGYLMFTLPVHTWELIVSKMLTATLVTCISVLDGVLSCGLLALFSTREMLSVVYWWKDMIGGIFKTGPIFVPYILLLIFLLILSMAKSIYHLYAAMAVGQLFEGHRVMGSFVSYIGISIVVSMASGIVSSATSWILPNGWAYNWYQILNHNMEMAGLVYLWVAIAITALQIVVFHVVTERVLATRLNLE